MIIDFIMLLNRHAKFWTRLLQSQKCTNLGTDFVRSTKSSNNLINQTKYNKTTWDYVVFEERLKGLSELIFHHTQHFIKAEVEVHVWNLPKHKSWPNSKFIPRSHIKVMHKDERRSETKLHKTELIQRLASKQGKPLLPHFERLFLAWDNLSKLVSWSVVTGIQKCKLLFYCFYFLVMFIRCFIIY